MSDRQQYANGNGGGGPSGPGRGDFGLTAWDDVVPHKEPRDPKKIALVIGLAVLSWVATYVGMLELIEANMGDLPLVHKIIIGFSVAMLMTMIVWLLDQMFKPVGFFTKSLYAMGYVFLTLISVGFGFGFYWKVLESRTEGTRGAETAVAQVQAPLQAAAARLDSLQGTLGQLQTLSLQKAELERTQGTSCPGSRPGDGPRRKLRDDDAGRFAFATDFVKGRVGQVKSDIAAIEADLMLVTKGDASIVDKSGTRNEFIKGLSRKLDSTVTNFNAFRGDPQLRQIRTELAERGDKTTFPDGNKTFSCPDQQLQTMIRSVVASIDALPVLERPKIVTVEGSDATIEAFRRLTATFSGLLTFKLPPSADELRELQKKAVMVAEGGAQAKAAVQMEQGGLSKRDYVPLSIAVFVDLCLLLVSLGKSQSRMQGLVPKMKEAERGPVIQILSRFNEIHRDRQIRENFEIFRHVVFDFSGDYYAAIPLIAPYSVDRRRPNAYGPADVEALQQEAHLLANLFTSFEKERLFTRVIMPIIPTSKIQKKLWAQGSKFAHAEAFRLYKFKDGAWQDMILGAIMGAAKRVEAEKRTRRIENDVFDRHTPSFGVPPQPAQSQVSAAGMEAAAHTLHEPMPTRTPAAFQQGVPRPQPAPQPNGGRPVAPPPPPHKSARLGAEDSLSFQPMPRRTRKGAATLPPLESDVVVKPANSNTAPVAERQVEPGPASRSGPVAMTAEMFRPAEDDIAPATDFAEIARGADTVEIAAVERSVTYRVPVSDITLTDMAIPQSIRDALERPQPVTAEATEIAADDVLAIGGPTIKLDDAAGDGGEDVGGDEPVTTDAVTEADVDIGRIADRFGLKSRAG